MTELPKIDLKQALENMKALREADPETLDRIMTASVNALANNPDFLNVMINTIKGSRSSDES